MIQQLRLSLTTVVSLFLIFLTFELFAQPRNIKFFPILSENELTENTISTLHQDSQGFLWIGTHGGLNRYDGYEFKYYTHDNSEPTSISGNSIQTLFEDSKGVLWVGTSHGLNRFDAATGVFISYYHDENDPESISDNNIRSITEDRNGNLWIGTGDGLNYLDRKTEKFIQIRHDPHTLNTLTNNNINQVFRDSKNHIWIATAQGLCKIIRRSDRLKLSEISFQVYQPSRIIRGVIVDNNYVTITEDQNGNIWFGSFGGGVTRYNRTYGEFHFYNMSNDSGLSTNRIRVIRADHLGRVWVGTAKGLNLWSPEEDRFSPFRYSKKNPYSLQSDSILDIIEDSSGILWVGSEKGVSRMIPETEPFQYYVDDPRDRKNLTGHDIMGLHSDRKGEIWLGTRNGLNRLDSKGNVLRIFQNELGNPNTLSDDTVLDIHKDQNGIVWIATISGGLNRYDPKTDSFTHFTQDMGNPKALQSNQIRVIHDDEQGNLWLGTNDGLVRFHIETEVFTTFTRDYVWAIKPKKNGGLWVGTWGDGFYHFDPNTEKITTTYRSDSENPHSLNNDRVGGFLEEQDGTLWVATWGGGLNHFDPQSKRFKAYTRKNGLPNDSIYAIQQDQQGKLWLSTDAELIRFDPETEAVRTFGFRDGVISKGFNLGSSAKGKDGKLYFGGVAGLVSFYPEEIKESQSIPPVVFTSFQKLSKKQNRLSNKGYEQIQTMKSLNLSYKDSLLSFEFAALDYRFPVNNQFAYKLEGYDQQWIQAGKENRVTYNNLPGGEYTLRIKGSTHHGVWNQTGASMKITITPPPWKTWWAYSLYVLAFVCVIGFLFWLQAKKQAKKAEERAKELKLKKRELEQERQISNKLRMVDQLKDEFLANTSHELRTPLNGIIGLTESLIDEKKGAVPQGVKQDLKLIINSGKRLFLLINDILDFVRLEKKDLRFETKPVNLREVVEFSIQTQIAAFSEKQLVWQNTVPDDIIVSADPDRLQQILQNLLGNALKFTFKGGISLSAEKQGEFTEIAVRDTGVGIDESNLSKIFERFEKEERSEWHGGVGLGLPITKSLVEKHGGTIRVESKPHVGSCFFFTLPLSSQPAEPIETAIPLTSVHSLEEEVPIPKKSTGESCYKILIVDDDPINLTALINQLDIGEFSLQKATDGTEALEAIEKEKPDLILMDIMMKKMSGIEACKMIRKQYGKLELPIIFQTCKDRDVDLKQALEAGGNDYITKPFSGMEVISRIHNHLGITNESRQLPQMVVDIISKIDSTVYITSSHDYACLYGYNNSESISEHIITLKKVTDYLGDQFVKVNRSTLVKLSEVDSIQTKSRRKLLQFKESFSNDFECALTKGNMEQFMQKFSTL